MTRELFKIDMDIGGEEFRNPFFRWLIVELRAATVFFEEASALLLVMNRALITPATSTNRTVAAASTGTAGPRLGAGAGPAGYPLIGGPDIGAPDIGGPDMGGPDIGGIAVVGCGA